MSIWTVALSVIAFAIAVFVLRSWLQLRRAEFIRTHKLPRGLLQKLMDHHPRLVLKDSALVSRGLRQFFVAYLMSGKEVRVDAVGRGR
jgi:hypothetical protein